MSFENILCDEDLKVAQIAHTNLCAGQFTPHYTKKYFSVAVLQNIARVRQLETEGTRDDLWDRLNDDEKQSDIDIEGEPEEEDPESEYDFDDLDEDMDPEETRLAFEEGAKLRPQIQVVDSLPNVDQELIEQFRRKYMRK